MAGSLFSRRFRIFLSGCIILIFFSSLGASTDSWKQFGQDINNSGEVNSPNVLNNPEVQWEFNTDGVIRTNPVINNGVVYFGGKDDAFYAVDTATGNKIWNTSIPEPREGSVYYQGKLYVPSYNDGLKVLDNETGTIEDTYFGSSSFRAAPTRYKDSIIIGDTSGTVHMLNTTTGTTSTIYQNSNLQVQASVAVKDDIVYITGNVPDTFFNNFIARNLDGTTEWAKNLGANTVVPPTIFQNQVVATVTDSASLVSYDLKSGSEEWSASTGFGSQTSGPATDGEYLYITHGSGGDLYRYDSSGDSPVNAVRTFASTNRGAISNGVYYAEYGSGIEARYTENLSTIWSLPVNTETSYGGPSLANGNIYFTSGNSLYKINDGPVDNEPPVIENPVINDEEDNNQIVKDEDEVLVWANVTDNQEVTSVETDLSEFGLGTVSMTKENVSNIDYDEDGQETSDIYGTFANVDGSSANDGTGKSATITATDGNSNSVTSSTFGSFTIDTQAPIYDSLNVSLVGTADPVFEANISETLSGLNQSATQIKVNDSSGDVFTGTVDSLTGVTAPNDENITFDFTQRPDSLSDGNVTVNITPVDEAGNVGNEKLKNFEVDINPPENFVLEAPVNTVFRQTADDFTVNYSYTEANPDFTEIRLIDSTGSTDASITVQEASSDPNSSVEFNLDNSSYSISAGEYYDVELYAAEEFSRSNSGSFSELLGVDDTPPELNASDNVSDTEFEFDVSDVFALNSSSVEASDFEYVTPEASGTFSILSCSDRDTSCTVSGTLDSAIDIYTLTVGLTASGSVRDLAGNILDTAEIDIQGMDGVPPSIDAYNLDEIASSDGIVTGGDAVKVYAKVTDGVKVSNVEANMTEFDRGSIDLVSEASAGRDWDGDSFQSSEVYGAEITVPESASDNPDASAWINATDNSSNKNTTPEFGSLKIDNTPPQVNIYTPIAKDGIINSSEASGFKVNGTVDNDNSGTIDVNVSDASTNNSVKSSFSGGTFSVNIDGSMLSDGSISVEAVATDVTGKTGDLASESIIKDTQPPQLLQGYRINSTAFNVTFSDSLTGLDASGFTASSFDLDPGVFDSVSDRFSSGDSEGNLTVGIDEVDSETVNFSISGNVRDEAGNRLSSGWEEFSSMDSVPPSFDYLNLSDWDDDGIVASGNKVKVFANISDGTGIGSAQANLTELDAGRVSLSNETEAGFDWNDDGELDSNVYGANATVGESVSSGTASATVNATDNSSNLNENTSEEFGSLDVVTEDPQINILSPLNSDPVYLRETEALDLRFNYTESDPDRLNVSVGPENVVFNSLSGGTDVESVRTLFSSDLPGNGTYDLDLNLTNTAGLSGNDSEASSVVIDSFAPGDLSIDAPTVKRKLQGSDDLSVDYSYTEANPDWTEVRLVNASGDEGLSINVSESGSDPDGRVEFTSLENLEEGVNYSIEVEASDKVGRTALVSDSNLLVVDDTAPALRDPRKITDGLYRFDIFDNASGISTAGLSSSALEIKEDVSASFNIMSCNSGDFNCTVEVDILEDINDEQLTAQITGSGEIFDIAGNSRNNDEVILEDSDTLKPALKSYELNVTEPVNNSYSSGSINLTLEFNESMKTSSNPSVNINNLDTFYAVSGSFINSTHWTGVFDILDEDEQSEAYINISNAEDGAGNTLMESKDSAIFDVDTEEPVINSINDFSDQNLSGTVDLTNFFEETTSNGFLDTFEYKNSGTWNNILAPGSWDSTQSFNGAVEFRVNASDSTGNTASITEASSVDNEAPYFNQSTVEIVDDGDTEGILNMDDNFSVEVNASDVHSEVSEVYADVSAVTDLSGFIALDEQPSGNYSKIFRANESAQISDYSPGIKAVDSPGNENVSTTENSVEVDTRPFELTPDSIYTLVGNDRYSNGIVNPGDEINVSWNSSETGISSIEKVEVDFGEFGSVVEASDQGEGVYSAVTTVSKGIKNGEGYFGNIEVRTSSGTDNETDDSSVPVNNELPAPPTSLSASSTSSGIELAWFSSSSPDADSYTVYRNGSVLGTASLPTYTDSSVVSGNEYVYKVSTVDNASNEGDNSSEVSEVADQDPPFIESAVTYNRTAINVTIRDDRSDVSVSDINIINLDPGSSPYYTGFGSDAPVVEGLFFSGSSYGTGAEPEITVDLEDTVGNSQGFDYTFTAEDGVNPEIDTLSMDNVKEDGEASLEIVYTEAMDQTVNPEIKIQGVTPTSTNGAWTGADTYSVDYRFDDFEGTGSATLVAGNASDDSGNVQQKDVSTNFELDTVVPEPSILDINDGANVSGDLLLNMSIVNGSDVDSVEWKYETGTNQSIALLGMPANETMWDTPDIERDVKLWLEASDPVGNTGTDSVEIKVDNIPPNLLGDLPDYISGIIDLEASIYADEDASVTYEYKESGVWKEVSNPSSWDSEEASEGVTDFRVNATDPAGNFKSSDYTAVVDNTEPGRFSFDNSSERLISPGEEFNVNYSYVEANPDNTTVKVLDSEGKTVSQRFIRESGYDPAENLTFDSSGYESDNYTVELTAEDLAGLENSTEALNVFVDDERPVLGNGTYYNDTRMSFEVQDAISGVDASTVDDSKFEVLTDNVDASNFNVVGCEQRGNCTVNVTLQDGSSLAEIGVTGSVTDRTGNEVENTVYIINPEVDGPQANMSLNVSQPYNRNDVGKKVKLVFEFDRKIDTGPREDIDFEGSTADYDLKGTYYNSTYWNGTFTLVDDSQEDDIIVNATDIRDLDGNRLLQNEVGSFKVDFRPPQIDLSGIDENVSGTLNLTSLIRTSSSGINSLNVTYGANNEISNLNDWNTSEIVDGEVTLEAEANDSAGNNATDSKEVTIDNSYPVVSNISLNASSDEVLDLNETLNITVNASDTGTGIKDVSADVSNISTQGKISLHKIPDGNYSNNVQINKETSIQNYSIQVNTLDYAGNSLTNQTGNVSVNSTQTDDGQDDSDDSDDGSDGSDGSDDSDDSGGGGSSGGGGGGGGAFLPPDDDDDDQQDDQDGTGNESGEDNSTLQPSPFSININPQRAFLESGVGDQVVYRPEISVSEASTVQLDLQGFEESFNRELSIQGSRSVRVDIGDFGSDGTYTGRLVASAEGVSRSTSISVEVSKEEQEVEMDSDFDEGKVSFNTSIDTDGNVEVTNTIYRADTRQVVYSSTNATTVDGDFESKISLGDLDPGLYTIETTIETEEEIYVATDQFRVEEPFSPAPLLFGFVILSSILALAYKGYGRSASSEISRKVSESPELQMESQTEQRAQRPSNVQDQTLSEDKAVAEEGEEEGGPFDEIDDMFEDDDIIREIEEASEKFGKGDVAGADSKLRTAKKSGFFDSESVEDVKDKMKKVHDKFEDRI